MSNNQHLVHFYFWCPKCEYCEKSSNEDPCRECLNTPANVDSHKPIFFKKNGGKKEMKEIKKNWKLYLIVVIGIISVIGMFIFSIQSAQNRAFGLEESINAADSDIKIQEKRRVDLIKNLADCVIQYDKHEAEILIKIAEARGGSNSDIENTSIAISAVAEAYPELKSDANYREFMNELSITENLIAEYRENYNKHVREYNRYIKKFPYRIFLNWLGYEQQNYKYLDYNAPVDAPQNLFGD